jgi:hypothetical protein
MGERKSEIIKVKARPVRAFAFLPRVEEYRQKVTKIRNSGEPVLMPVGGQQYR